MALGIIDLSYQKGGLIMPGINVLELPTHLQKKVSKGQPKAVSKRVVILGKVLSLFKGMNRRDARWILKQAVKQI